MRIQRGNEIEGVSLINIRSLFRKAGIGATISSGFVAGRLNLTRYKSERLIAALERMGMVEPTSVVSGRGSAEPEWRLTTMGNRLRAATARKPIQRATADRLLSAFLDRCDALNRRPHFLARVERAAVFGSYLGDQDRIGDLDIAVRLAWREPDADKHRVANDKRVAQLAAKGRQFTNLIDRMFWWQREAVMFLRGRSAALSLHEYEGVWAIVEASPHLVVYPPTGLPRARQG